MSALAVRDMVFRWPRQAVPCLDVAHLEIAAGERVFLHGPSGSGKSTLLGVIGGVALPERGRVELLGTDTTRLSSRARDAFRANHVGFIFQQFNLLPWLSAIDNVVLPCAFSARRRQRVGQPTVEAERLLGQLDLAPALWSRPAAELSVGEQQRVAAARALVGRPEMIVADEPTSALDAPRQQAFIDLLLREAAVAGTAVLFVSHDPRLASRFDRAIALAEVNRASSERP